MQEVRCFILSDRICDDPNPRGAEIRVPSSSFRGTFYTIKFSPLLHRLVCSCPDFQYRRIRNGENCKHIQNYLREVDNGKRNKDKCNTRRSEYNKGSIDRPVEREQDKTTRARIQRTKCEVGGGCATICNGDKQELGRAHFDA